ncbi:phosphoenolpyruvate--protein phosphotransferase [Terrarubrum flagellatum]|uniref:phosphoenolpyruvate--protein phosphotransferase n=1 Tax=Terrirubrum flagellatum TaxID=2895980 RepID=UPI0031454EC2
MRLERAVRVRVREGLHARPATEFVKLAKAFSANVEIFRGDRSANAKSSVKLMLLGVKEDDDVVLRADGDDAEEAIAKLAAFVETPGAGLDALKPAVAAAASSSGGAQGVAASEGVAIGPVFAYFPEPLIAPRATIDTAMSESEKARCRAALNAAIAALEQDAAERSAEDRQIANALIEIACDAEFTGDIEQRIGHGLDAASATLDAGDALAARFEALDDPYLRARAEDVRGVARNVALALLGRSEASLAAVPQGSILVADEISAWEFAKAPVANIAGIVGLKGAATSHVAIMARAHGVPAVLGCNIEPRRLREAHVIAIDGGAGAVILDPDETQTKAMHARVAADRTARAALDAWRTVEPRTREGKWIEVLANIGSPAEVAPALRSGAMGVGLFRTELLFMERKAPPSEDEQAEIYAKVASAFAPHAVVIRTLDVGGDKPVAGIEIPHEDNPFLGWRGVRLCLDRPDIFKPQLKAILRAAASGHVKLMIPMVVDVEEVRKTRALIEECRAELAAQSKPFGEVAVGIMIETPAAALLADELAKEVDFFSIGTNDLTQYVMAADRLNPRVASLNRADHPAVLRAIDLVCRAARAADIPVAVCGEAAADPAMIPKLVALGVTELSMNPPAIPRARKRVTEI